VKGNIFHIEKKAGNFGFHNAEKIKESQVAYYEVVM